MCKEVSSNGLRCSQCKVAKYCSIECQVDDWRKGGHKHSCIDRELIEGFIVMDQGQQGKKKDGNNNKGQLKILIDDLLAFSDPNMIRGIFEEKDWELQHDFFEGLRKVMYWIRDRAMVAVEKTQKDFDRAVVEWFVVKTGQGGQQQQQQQRTSQQPGFGGVDTTPVRRGERNTPSTRGADEEQRAPTIAMARQEWTTTRTAREYIETMRDQPLIALQKQEVSLLRIVKACNKHIGYELRTPAGMEMDNLVARSTRTVIAKLGDREIIEHYTRLAKIEDWNPLQSLWLAFDWDGENSVYVEDKDASPVRKKGRSADSRPWRPLISRNYLSRSYLEAVVADNRIQWLQELYAQLEKMRDSVKGLDDVKDQFAVWISQLLFYPGEALSSGGFINFMVFGEPGTGKTTLASALPPLLYYMGYCPVDKSATIISKQDLIAPYEGQTSHKTRMLILDRLGSCVVLDEAYDLVGGYSGEALTQIVNDLDVFRGLFVMGMLGYEEQTRKTILGGNPGNDRRFPYKFVIRPYNGKELLSILFLVMGREGYEFNQLTKQGRAEVEELMEALFEKGAFKNLNAGAVAMILEAYRNVTVRAFSKNRLEGKTQAKIVDSRRMIDALVEFAESRGFNVVMTQDAVLPGKETPNTTTD